MEWRLQPVVAGEFRIGNRQCNRCRIELVMEKYLTRRHKVIKQKRIGIAGLALLLAALLAVAAAATEKGKTTHPELSAQEMLMDCADCHREATPEVEKQWFQSKHGIAMVKCYQCHGTFETFAVTPSKADCATCHKDMLAKCPQEKACWECHTPHAFKKK